MSWSRSSAPVSLHTLPGLSASRGGAPRGVVRRPEPFGRLALACRRCDKPQIRLHLASPIGQISRGSVYLDAEHCKRVWGNHSHGVMPEEGRSTAAKGGSLMNQPEISVVIVSD